MTHYFLIKALNVNSREEDLFSGYFFDNAAAGVSEDLSFTQLDHEYSVQTIEKKFKDLNIYYSQRPEENVLLKAKTLFPQVKFEIEMQLNKDWMSEWKKGFKEFSLTENINIVPSWLKPKNDQDLNVFIDPGMAFGTGTHDTTQIAASLIKEVDIEGRSVIDVGTGTAILAIVCENLGAADIEATEIDDTARDVAKKNIILNKCKKTNILDVQIESLSTDYDVVIANIIDGVLIKIQNDLKSITKNNGHLILTGILQEREEHFLKEFSLSEFKIIKRVRQQEWLGFLLQKK